MKSRTATLILFVFTTISLLGCESIYIEGGTHPDRRPDDRRSEDDRRTEPDRRDVLPRQFQIPPGHHPPPGECRIWYPNRPPGQQPPPGSCSELEHNVPHNAWLVERMPGKKNIRVSRYHPERSGVTVEVHIYDLKTGELKVDVK